MTVALKHNETLQQQKKRAIFLILLLIRSLLGAEEEHSEDEEGDCGGNGRRVVGKGTKNKALVLVVLEWTNRDVSLCVQHRVALSPVEHTEFENTVIVRGDEPRREFACGSISRHCLNQTDKE